MSLIAAVGAWIVLTSGHDALAWGPATHISLASDLLSNLSLLPAGIAALIAAHRRFFVYGNVATDTVFAKKLTKIKQICHHWSTGFGFLDAAESDEGKAFAYGYLAHLAADTVAHNKFLPRQMAVSRSTITFGHLYWEIRADALIERPHWVELRKSLSGKYAEPEHLMRDRLRETLLSYKTNRILFKQMNLLASELAWRRSVDCWAKISRYDLDRRMLDDYRSEALDRVMDVFEHGRASPVLFEDPNGNAALSLAKAQRRQLRQMKRARLPHAHIIREAANGHAPRQIPASAEAAAIS